MFRDLVVVGAAVVVDVEVFSTVVVLVVRYHLKIVVLGTADVVAASDVLVALPDLTATVVVEVLVEVPTLVVAFAVIMAVPVTDVVVVFAVIKAVEFSAKTGRAITGIHARTTNL